MMMMMMYAYIGRLALFYSSEVAHEVLPTFGERHALTIWYNDHCMYDCMYDDGDDGCGGDAIGDSDEDDCLHAQTIHMLYRNQCLL